MVLIFQRGQEGCQALQRVLEVYQAAQQDQEVCDPIQEACALLLSLHLLLLLQWWQVAFSELYRYNLTIKRIYPICGRWTSSCVKQELHCL